MDPAAEGKTTLEELLLMAESQSLATGAPPSLLATGPQPPLPVTESQATGPQPPLLVTGPQTPLAVAESQAPLPATGPQPPSPESEPTLPELSELAYHLKICNKKLVEQFHEEDVKKEMLKLEINTLKEEKEKIALENASLLQNLDLIQQELKKLAQSVGDMKRQFGGVEEE